MNSTEFSSVSKQKMVVKFMHMQKKDANDIMKQLQGVCAESAPSYKEIKQWIKDFEEGKEDTSMENGNGPASMPSDPALIARLEQLICEDQRITLDQLAEMTNVSKHNSALIINDILGLKRVKERWVGKSLTPEQRQYRLAICQQLLERAETEGDSFTERLIIGDETFVHYYAGDSQRRPSCDKYRPINQILTLQYCYFYDSKGLLLAHLVPEKTVVDVEFYSYVLKELLMPEIKRKRKDLADKPLILLHDVNPIHSAKMTQATLQELNMEVLPVPPSSPDLLPFEYWLFPAVMQALKGATFKNRSTLWSAIQHFCNNATETDYRTSIKKLLDRWTTCIENNGMYMF
ncbi:unnamed protein product [Meganyctiphanes norvegica]|uniref:Transposase n=1 Tax=Meganyctiphanes norvegica TaxID=48144 RepID=A0AAV2QM22_MEGNR